MKCHDIELCGSTIAVVLQKVNRTKDHLDGEKVFKQFVEENSKCLWKPELVKSVSLLRYSGNLLDPFTILMRGSQDNLRIIRETWSIRVLRPPPGFHIQIVGDVNRIRAHPLSRGHFIPLREAVCVAIGNITSHHDIASQTAILREIADTFGDGISTAHVPSQELLHETLGKLIKDRIVFCTGDGYHISRKDTYCHSNNVETKSPIKAERKKCCCSRCTKSATTHNNTHCVRKRGKRSKHDVYNSNHDDRPVDLNQSMPNMNLPSNRSSVASSKCSKPESQPDSHFSNNSRSEDKSIVDKFTHVIFGRNRDHRHRRHQRLSAGCEHHNTTEVESTNQNSTHHHGNNMKKHSHSKERKHKKCPEPSTKNHNRKLNFEPHHQHVQHSQLHGTAIHSSQNKHIIKNPTNHRKKSNGLQRSRSLKLPRERQLEITSNLMDRQYTRHFSSDDPLMKHSSEKRRTSLASSSKQEYSLLHASPTAPSYRIGSVIADYLVESKKLDNAQISPVQTSTGDTQSAAHQSSLDHGSRKEDSDLESDMQSLSISDTSDDYDTKMAVKLAKRLSKLGVKMTREEWKSYFTSKELPNYVWEKLKTPATSPVESQSTYFEEAGSLETVIDCGKNEARNSNQIDPGVPTTVPYHRNLQLKNMKDVDTLTEDSGFNSSREVSSAVSHGSYRMEYGSMV